MDAMFQARRMGMPGDQNYWRLQIALIAICIASLGLIVIAAIPNRRRGIH